MKKPLKTALIAAATLFGMTLAASSQAAAYKCMDDKGKAIYSDIPCSAKIAPPKIEPAKAIAKAAEPAVLTKLTESEVLRLIAVTDDYTRSYNHADICNLYTADMKYQMNNTMVKPPRTLSAGRDEACQAARDSAEQSKRAGLVVISERGATKVSVEPGDARASAVYELTMRLTRYDRVISTYHCSAKNQVVLVSGKALFSSVDETCKP
ncbi:MAG: hypothetical protein JWN73_213 [Betaproteobacteria bacterium]|nr:hypothetical protein [Betaproteobacteria bacterium]